MALNVLVVDDSSVMRSMIIRSLRLSGIEVNEVHQASNGEEGLRVIENNWIDLALIDLNMPVMSGEEMIGKLRKNPDNSNLAIIVVSTEGSLTRIAQLRGQGAEFVHKPFSPEIFRETIIGLTGVSYADPSGAGTLQGGNTDF
jgi:two-component system, chemotaxis family, chemotaxis protein CheY